MKEVIQVIFEHLTKCQEMMGAKDTFQFKSVKVGKIIVWAPYRLCNENAETDHNQNAEDDDSIVPSANTPDHHHRIGIPGKKAMILIHDHHNADGIIIHGDCDSNMFIIIDQETMQTVQEVMAMDMPIPYNGPADGLP